MTVHGEQVISDFSIYFNARLIFLQGEFWRLFTNFLFFGNLGNAPLVKGATRWDALTGAMELPHQSGWLVDAQGLTLSSTCSSWSSTASSWRRAHLGAVVLTSCGCFCLVSGPAGVSGAMISQKSSRADSRSSLISISDVRSYQMYEQFNLRCLGGRGGSVHALSFLRKIASLHACL